MPTNTYQLHSAAASGTQNTPIFTLGANDSALVTIIHPAATTTVYKVQGNAAPAALYDAGLATDVFDYPVVDKGTGAVLGSKSAAECFGFKVAPGAGEVRFRVNMVTSAGTGLIVIYVAITKGQ